MKKKGKITKASWGLLVVLFLSLAAFTGKTELVEKGQRYFDIARNLDIFATLFREVNAYYVDEVNPNTLMKTGVDAMLESLDPYTNYIPEDDIEDYRTMTTGEYGGIGALIGRNRGKNVVMMPYEGFPAEKSGLKVGDQILEIDGIDVSEKNTSDISKLLKGQANTSLKIKIQRMDSETPETFQIHRKKITLKNVPYYGKVNDNVGYIKLTDFTTGAGKEVRNALKDLKGEGVNSVILDLRGNPGGLLNEAVNVSNVFVSKGKKVVYTKGKVTDWNKTYKTLNGALDDKIPLVVLTNGRSASASEIVSGVMQDYDRGVLVGSRTFGKGLVQTTRPLSYNSRLKVTTAKYYIPSGRCIQAIDYSQKDKNGHGVKLADSLKTAFKTKNGRVVYDGAGLNPDIEVKRTDLPPIAISLLNKGLVFDYATTYYYNNQGKNVDPKSFAVSDKDYADFVAWLSDKDYDYETRSELALERLIELTSKESMSEGVQDELVKIGEKIRHDKKADLTQFQKQIRPILSQEISGRFFLSRGMVESGLKHDPDVKKALDILSDKEKYESLLTSNQ
ncbi:peptidase S41 [Fulvitalea axinellae]|uniref:Peptidase S41 n=1 Tax=Fulvitalea axinellae TaxID=1182444 RepID=A0AAU9D830_9BACT|nr:peptidase S41 [Fulvitalea axinellae]